MLARCPTQSTSRVRQGSKYALDVPAEKLLLLRIASEPKRCVYQWDESVPRTPDKNYIVLPSSDIDLDPEDAVLMYDNQLSIRGND